MSEEVIPSQVSLELSGFTLARAGLLTPPDATFEQWQKVGEWLSLCDGAVHWWIGDWLNYGEAKYGEMYTQALDATGFEYQTLADDKWVAGAVQFSFRKEKLSHAHHKAVAKLPPLQQKALLDLAEEKGMSWSDLRALVAERKCPSLEVEVEKPFNSLLEAEATGAWLRERLAKWPKGQRHHFPALLRRLAEIIEEELK